MTSPSSETASGSRSRHRLRLSGGPCAGEYLTEHAPAELMGVVNADGERSVLDAPGDRVRGGEHGHLYRQVDEVFACGQRDGTHYVSYAYVKARGGVEASGREPAAADCGSRRASASRVPTERNQMENDKSILIIEGDDAVRVFLADNLRADRYCVRCAQTIEQGRVMARGEGPDALVLGECAEVREAIELVREIRAGGELDPSMAILLVAKVDQLTTVRAFDAGCDDVVGRPFSYPELRARLAAVLRRGRPADRLSVRVGRLRVDSFTRTAAYGDLPLALTRIEFALLLRLASQPTRVFTKAELLREVWGFHSLGQTRTVDAHACRLRAKLAEAGAPHAVVNLRGVGYRLTDVPVGVERNGALAA